MLIRWLGHATVLLALDGVRLLTDPLLRGRLGPLVRTAAPVKAGDLASLDCVLLSHLHADHTDPASLRRLGTSTPILAPRGAGNWLRRAGLSEVMELGAGEETRVGSVRVAATPARHSARRYPRGGPVAEPVGFVVSGSRSAYFAGDTDLFAGMAGLNDRIDAALLPVWGWGRSLGSGHLDPEGAAEAARIIAPRTAIPIHWGTLALGWPWRPVPEPDWPARRFAEVAATRAPGVDVRVLAPGEATELR